MNVAGSVCKAWPSNTSPASSSPFSSSYEGMNFALALPASETIDLIFAGQTGIGDGAPQRFETTARMRVNDRHHLSLSGGGARFVTVIDNNQSSKRSLGQMSVRAVDEWLVRDGVVVVMGLDYSRFTNAGSDSAISPRFGIQFDANARTRVRASYAPAGDESAIQSTASFEASRCLFQAAIVTSSCLCRRAGRDGPEPAPRVWCAAGA